MLRYLWNMLFARGTAIQFFEAEAESVSLAIEGFDRPWNMEKARHGVWQLKLRLPIRKLEGRTYKFAVRHRNGTKWVADPLARHVERREQGLVSIFNHVEYRFENPEFRAPKLRDIVIYEAHLPALSRHESAQVEDQRHRGTYVGARSPEILDHLQKLKVALEFLPLHTRDKLLGQDWGYYSTAFRAMRKSYAVDKRAANREIMALVDALHGRGIPVLLDVVFNHGGELLVKAWGKEIVYRKFDDGNYCHGSGCGPTIRTEHPLIRETIIETLEHLANDYRFDGFRFDLGALHDVRTMLEIDRRLPDHIYLIAEPWALGGVQWGKADMSGRLAKTRWAIWNDDFREPGRKFVLGHGDHHNRDRLQRALIGSHVDDGGWALRPQQSINYLSSHDGQTLADLMHGDKHRVFLGVMLVLVSQGVPMLGEGSELMFTKHGHHNSYDRPDLNQIDWGNLKRHNDLVVAVANLIKLRLRLPHFRYVRRLRRYSDEGNKWDIKWIYPTGYPHHDNVNAIGFELRSPVKFPSRQLHGQSLVVLLNGSRSAADFHLPEGRWKLLVDGRSLAVDMNGISGAPLARNNYHTHAATGFIFAQVDNH